MTKIPAALVKELRARTGLGMLDCKRALAANDGDVDLAIQQLRKESGLQAAKKAGRIAADGLLAISTAENASRAVILEVNIETDFAARNSIFAEFVEHLVQVALQRGVTDAEQLMTADLEEKRKALVQEIGENISVRRLALIAPPGEPGEAVVGTYLHSNNKVGALVALRRGDARLGRDLAMHVTAANPLVVSPQDIPDAVLAKEREIYAAQAAELGRPQAIMEKIIEGRLRKFVAASSLTEQPFVKDMQVNVGQLVRAADAEILSFVRFEVGEGIAKEAADFAEEVAAQVRGG